MMYLLGGLLDGSGGLAQGAVHVLGADLEGLGTSSLDQVVLGYATRTPREEQTGMQQIQQLFKLEQHFNKNLEINTAFRGGWGGGGCDATSARAEIILDAVAKE